VSLSIGGAAAPQPPRPCRHQLDEPAGRFREGSGEARPRPCRRLLGTSRALERSDGGGSGGSARQAVSSSASEAKAASYCVYPMQGPVRLANETPLQRPALTSTRAGPIQQ